MKKWMLFFLLIPSSFLIAQTRLGIQGGLAAGNMRQRSEQTNCAIGCDKGTHWGLKAGVFVQMPLSSHLSFNPALNYVQKGGKYRLNAADQAPPMISRCAINLHYIELSANLLYHFQNLREGFFAGAGPFVGAGVGGKRMKTVETTISGVSQKTVTTHQVLFDGGTTSGDELHFKNPEIGASLLLGYSFHNGLRFQAEAVPGFSNLYSDKVNGTYRNFYFGVAAGYLF